MEIKLYISYYISRRYFYKVNNLKKKTQVENIPEHNAGGVFF